MIYPQRASCLDWRDRWLLPLLDGAGLIELTDVDRLRDTGATSAWEACLAIGVSDDAIAAAVAARYRLSLANLDDVGGVTAARLLSAETAARFGVVPLGHEGGALALACSDPTDADMEQSVSFGAGRRVHLQIASPRAIAAALARLYPGAAGRPARARATRPGTPLPAAPEPSPALAACGGRALQPARSDAFDALSAAFLADMELAAEDAARRPAPDPAVSAAGPGTTVSPGWSGNTAPMASASASAGRTALR